MSEFKIYINKLLRKTKLDKAEREDLENELLDHLNNIKEDYLKQGLAENTSIDRAIADFKKSDFLKEINNFSSDKKLSGLNLGYLFKVSSILFFIYFISIGPLLLLFNQTSQLYIVYFIIISILSFINYTHAHSRFASKKDMLLNISLTSLVLFIIGNITTLIWISIFKHLNLNFESYVLSTFKPFIYMNLIYILVSLSIILFANFRGKVLKMGLLILSLNLIYFISSSTAKLFNSNFDIFKTNLLYININYIIIFNIGLLMLVSFIIFKLLSIIFNSTKIVR